jgi:hypothetical protein
MEPQSENTSPSKLAPPEITKDRDEKVVARKVDSLKSSLAYLKRRSSAALIRITKAPDEVRSVLQQVDEIHKTKGVLRLSGKLTPALLCLIMMHSKFDKIKKIVLGNFTFAALDEFDAEHKVNISRFKELFGISVPREVIYYANFCHQVNAAFGKYLLGPKAVGGMLYLYGFEGLSGIWGKVFSNRSLSESDILTDRQGHHQLSYFPMFNYGSDGVSHGLVFDYQTNSFAGIAYYGDGAYQGCSTIMDGFVEYALNRCESFSDSVPEDILQSFDKEYGYPGFCDQVEEIKEEIMSWFLALAASGYVSEMPVSVPRPNPFNMVRYGYQNAKAKEKLGNNGWYFVKGIYPGCVVKLRKLFGNNFWNKHHEKSVELLDKIFSLMDWVGFDAYELVKHLIENKQFDLFGDACDEFSITFDNDGYLTEKSSDEILEILVQLAEKRSRDGYHELAFCMVFALWNMGTEQSTDYAFRLAEIIPNDVLHPIVKIMVMHHAKTRFDKFIML